MKTVFIQLLVFFTFSILLKGQFYYPSEYKLVRDFNLYQSAMGKTMAKNDLQYTEISGSPYLNREFRDTEIFSQDSIRYINVKFRYNIYTDQLEYLMNNEVLILANPTDFKYFIIGELVFVHQTYISPGGSPRRGYFQLLYTGSSACLLKRHHIIFVPAEEAQAYAAAKPARFTNRPDSYYIRFPGKLPVEVKLNRRRVLDVFSEKRKELENFISTKRLNFSSESDLFKLVEFYNQL